MIPVLVASLLAGSFERVRGTEFAQRDTRLFSPLCALLGAGFFWIAASR